MSPAGRRAQVLRAAVTVLAEGGARGLTHRAVDSAGGLPAGTTSNHFRSRLALVDGVLEQVTAQERAVTADLLLVPTEAVTADGLVELCAAVVHRMVGPLRQESLARYAIVMEAARHDELRPALRGRTEPWWQLSAEVLAAAGAPDAERRGRTLLACLDGVVLDQLVRPDPGFDPAVALAPVVRGLLARP